MASSMIDSSLYHDSYGTAEMREIFDDRTIMQNWFDIESALAQTQAKYSIIPQEAADEITRKGRAENMDVAAIESEINRVGHSLVPVLRYFETLCDNNYGEYIHLGATTQDIIDTGFMLSIKRGYKAIYRDAREAEESLLKLIDEHSETVMAGRSHTQQALPITFGYKVAVWASELRRDIDRMQECWKRCFVGELSGAVGTMAGFGEHGVEISEEAIRMVGLQVPDIAWHVSRDRLAEICTTLSILCCTFGRIGKEIASLQTTENGELTEGFRHGLVGSSTMPHKRNPNLAEALQCLARSVKASMGLSMESMFCEHERDGAFWKIEWKSVNEVVIMSGACADKAKKLLAGLQVHPDIMKENLYKLKGLMMSENVMLEMGKHIGKQSAHALIYEICMDTFEKHADFLDMLMANKMVCKYFTREELQAIMDPTKYTGHSAFLARRVAENIRAARVNDHLD